MRLGEWLLRDGHISREQLEQAIDHQGTDGGRLGTVLVELGFLDLDTLTVYLGLELSLPIATGAMMDRAKRTAVRLLSPDQALQFRCVPLMISDRQLIAAIDDPNDLTALDELARATGYRIIPRVAPEIRIYYYIERFYGIARPKRFRRFGDTPRGQRKPAPPAGNLPGPSLPGLPPRAEAPVAAPTPAPKLAVTRPPTEDPITDRMAKVDADSLRHEAREMVIELEADAADEAGEAPAMDEFAQMPPTQQIRRPRKEGFAPHSLEDALAIMTSASQRGEVADAVMCYACGVFDVSALLIVRDNLAFGWKATGGEVTMDRVEALLVPLDAPSIFRMCVDADNRQYAGEVFPSALHRYLFRVLRASPPRKAVVNAIMIGKRVVNLLYGHNDGDVDLSAEQLDGLRTIAREASAAYVRLISAQKSDDGDGD